MILAAGHGERMQPLTLHTPKPLLKAGDKRIIEYTIEALVIAGFNDIVINHAHLGEQIPAFLGDGTRYQAKISYSAEPGGPYETAGGIINALPLLGDEPFIVVNGDIWTDYPFKQLKKVDMTKQLCHLVLVPNPQHHPSGDFSLPAGQLSEQGTEKYTYSGIGIYQPALFKGYKVDNMTLKPFLVDAINQHQASGELYQGQWSDIGTIERLQQLDKQLLVEE